jgi:DNA-binding CsgD family transcriptional regulator
MLRSEKDDLLDQIYETAYEPAIWPAVFERLADKLGGAGAWLSQLDALDGSGGSTDDPLARIDPIWMQRYAEYFGAFNPLQRVDDPGKFLREWKPIVHTDEEWIAKDDLVRTEFYAGFLKPQDIYSIMWIRIAKTGTQTATLNVTRPERRGRFETENLEMAREYQPHLIRAFNLSKKIGASRRQTREAEELLDFSSHGLFLLDGNGTLRHANRAAEKILGEGGAFALRAGKLCTVQPAASRVLEKLIAAAASIDPALRTGGSMALLAEGRMKPFSVIVAPVGRDRFISLREGLSVCVCVTDLEAEARLPEDALRDVLGLTPAETRLARALFAGANLQEAANRFDVSLNTVRVQLASVFDKTQTNRQSDLIALLSRLAQHDR